MSQIDLNVYLFFERTAREAMEFYQGFFGGELTMQTRGQVDPSAPEAMKELLIHGNLEGGAVHLMAADNTDAGTSPQKRISVSLNGDDEPKCVKFRTIWLLAAPLTIRLKKNFGATPLVV